MRSTRSSSVVSLRSGNSRLVLKFHGSPHPSVAGSRVSLTDTSSLTTGLLRVAAPSHSGSLASTILKVSSLPRCRKSLDSTLSRNGLSMPSNPRLRYRRKSSAEMMVALRRHSRCHLKVSASTVSSLKEQPGLEMRRDLKIKLQRIHSRPSQSFT